MLFGLFHGLAFLPVILSFLSDRGNEDGEDEQEGEKDSDDERESAKTSQESLSSNKPGDYNDSSKSEKVK